MAALGKVTKKSPLQQAEQQSIGRLCFSKDETELWDARLQRAHANRGLEVVLWATVRYLGVNPNSKKPMWEQAFSLPYEKGGVLGKFVASFKDYVREDVPHVMPRKNFQALMRANPHEQDFVQYCQLAAYLKRRGSAWSITTQQVSAWRDPRQNPGNAFLAAIASFFGERVECPLVEYCLVLDVPETLLRKQIATKKRRKKKKKNKKAESNSSSTTFDASSDSSSAATETLAVSDMTEVGLELARPVPPVLIQIPAKSSLLCSASSSSHGLNRIKPKSLSLSSSGHRQ